MTEKSNEQGSEPIFVLGAPRSGTTIVAQAINAHPDCQIFDEVDLLDIAIHGLSVGGRAHEFLKERNLLSLPDSVSIEGMNNVAALDAAMSRLIMPKKIWGEKNPAYAPRIDTLLDYFPDALVVLVVRDPRQVVQSYLRYKDSPSRRAEDFWIVDSVEAAIPILESHLLPVLRRREAVVEIRYEEFFADPSAVLNEALRSRGLSFPPERPTASYPVLESVGDHQFLRDGSVLPWKSANLAPVQDRKSAIQMSPDPAWGEVERLAQVLGYA